MTMMVVMFMPGRLLNCFSKEQDQVDEALPDSVMMTSVRDRVLVPLRPGCDGPAIVRGESPLRNLVAPLGDERTLVLGSPVRCLA
jgi:hypothetical protein